MILHFRPILSPLLLFSFITIITSTGCRNEDVSVYQVEKGAETITSEKPEKEVIRSEPSDETRLWKLPAGWVETESNVPMRFATILVQREDSDPIEVAITVFPGDVGGELANVNRWRGQMGLDELQQAELDHELRRFTSQDFNGYYLRINGDGEVLLAGGNYSQKEDRTWFARTEKLLPSQAELLEDQLFEFLQTFGQENQY